RRSQVTGTIILIKSDSSKIENLQVQGQALIVSEAGPTGSEMYDQVQGDSLLGLFDKGEINVMTVWPNAESIYYAKDDAGAYLGMNKSESYAMRIMFEDGAIHRIVMLKDAKQVMTPISKVNFSSAKLSRFVWHFDKRPQSYQSFFQTNESE